MKGGERSWDLRQPWQTPQQLRVSYYRNGLPPPSCQTTFGKEKQLKISSAVQVTNVPQNCPSLNVISAETLTRKRYMHPHVHNQDMETTKRPLADEWIKKMWCVYIVLSRVQLFATPWTPAHQSPCSWGFPGKNPGVGYHFLL